ncbi:MAG: hypothetical protein ACM3WV_04280 [Bacillota bacterium]
MNEGKYEYCYKNRRTRTEIKREGRCRPISAEHFYRQLIKKRKANPQFYLQIKIAL